MSDISQRLVDLRQQMSKNSIDFYYVPSSDAHNNEYVPDCWLRRVWISGFTGSAGDALIGSDEAFLCTDPRYYLQAEQELDALSFSLMKSSQGSAANHILQWLIAQGGSVRVGVDPMLIPASVALYWQQALSSIGGELVYLTDNLIDDVWHDQPKLEQHEITLLPVEYTGEDVASKIARVQQYMQQNGQTAHIVSALDAICWLFNIRGRDVSFNPLVISYACIKADEVLLFMKTDILTDEQTSFFADLNIKLLPYDQVGSFANSITGNILLDSGSSSWWLYYQLQNAKVILGDSPITMMKACKNSVEQAGMARAHKIDAIAIIKFWIWLEQNWQGQTEVTLADKLEYFRRLSPECRGLSFPTICGFADHGAIIHYRADEDIAHTVDDSALLLLDSGGQYISGTTDITRVFHFGKPTKQERHDYTLVLRGHLALGNASFPHGTCGEHLDVLARHSLWQEYCNFGHGTGHGVGCYLCVHEGPQRISGGTTGVPLLPGMIVSNEPGYYVAGEYGIRIENLCRVAEVAGVTDSRTGHGPFYELQDLTLVPYDKKLFVVDELSAQEIQWINDYHAMVYSELASDLSPQESAWLQEKTSALVV